MQCKNKKKVETHLMLVKFSIKWAGIFKSFFRDNRAGE